MSYRGDRVAYRVVEEADKPSCLKERIDPAHLLQAIENSFEHDHETAHGVTGVAFERYTISVRKRQGLCWIIECKFKARDTDTSFQPSRSR